MEVPPYDEKKAVQEICSVWKELPELFKQFEDQHDEYLKAKLKLPPDPDPLDDDDEENSIPDVKQSTVDLEKEKVLEKRSEIKSQINEIEKCLKIIS